MNLKYTRRPVANGFDVIDLTDGCAVLASIPQDRITDVIQAMNAAYERGHEDGFEEAAQR